MIALIALTSTTGCSRVSHVLPFESATEMLHWRESTLFIKSEHSRTSKHRHLDSSHISYLAKLHGQACTSKKWMELTVKALRTRTATRSVESLEQATYIADAMPLQKGDIIRFAARPRSPSHGVIVEDLGQGTYAAYTLVSNRIEKIKVNPRFSSQRRRHGRIINSFIRTITPADRKGGYLAGEMITSVSRPETGF